MPKGSEKNSRIVEIHPDAQKVLDQVIDYVVKHKMGDKKSVIEQYHEVWECGDAYAEGLIKRGYEDRRAQIWAAEMVNERKGRAVIKPKYGAYFKPVSVIHKSEPDPDKPGKIKHSSIAFGQVQLVDIKKDQPFPDVKLAEVKA